MNSPQVSTVAELQRQGVLFVEDGNHGEYRPLQHEFCHEGTPFIRPDDLKRGRVDFSNSDRINDDAFRRVRKGLGRAGDIVFTHRATVGRIARVGSDAPDFVANPGVTVWRSTAPSVLDPDYLYFFMQSAAFMNQVWAEAGNTDTFPYISLTQQRGLKIILPPIEAQQMIGSTLAVLDDKIELNRRMNATLEAVAQAIFRDWFVDFGPVRRKLAGATDPVKIMGGLVADPVRAAALADSHPDALDGEKHPVGWDIRPLSDLTTELRRGIGPKYVESGGVLVLNQKCIRDREVSFGPARRHDNNAKGVAGRTLLNGDVLVNSTGVGTLGRIAQIWGLEQPVIVDSHVTIVRARSTDFSAIYLGLALGLREEEIVALGEGSTGQTELSREQLGRMEMVVPAKHVLDQFDAICAPLIERIQANRQEAATLGETRDYLLPRLMSGEVRVRDAAREIAA